MDLMSSAKAAAEKAPATVNGSLLTIGTGLVAVAAGAIGAEQYWPALAFGLGGALVLFLREKLP